MTHLSTLIQAVSIIHSVILVVLCIIVARLAGVISRLTRPPPNDREVCKDNEGLVRTRGKRFGNDGRYKGPAVEETD